MNYNKQTEKQPCLSPLLPSFVVSFELKCLHASWLRIAFSDPALILQFCFPNINPQTMIPCHSYLCFVSVEFYTLWWAGFFCVWCFIGSNCNSYLYCREIPMVSKSQLEKVCLYENVPEKCDGTSDCGDSNCTVSVSIWWRCVTRTAVFYYLLITSKKPAQFTCIFIYIVPY